jgi:catechol 2,3-dioxygenase-like lactoylglutathione lyase family enzyme
LVRVRSRLVRGLLMKIEHVGLNVPDPAKAAEWYVANLGMKVVRAGGEPAHARFLADDSGKVMLETYHNAKAPVPDYASMDLLVLHVAFLAEDVPGTYRRLLSAGARPLSPPETLPNGDRIAAVRDPWGLPVQVVKRAESMVG